MARQINLGSTAQRTLSKANQTAYRRAEKNNEVFLNRLIHDVGGFGKEILAIGAASALDVAVTSAPKGGTKYDSGRAAANWDLMVGGKTRRNGKTSELSPAYYDNSRFKGVGQRKSHGIPARKDIPKIKALNYGYESTMGTGPVKLVPGKWLWDTIGIGEPGTKSVAIFNPLMFAIKRVDGFGRTYAQNAFPDLPSKSDFVRLSRTTILMAGQAFVYEKIRKMNERVRKSRFSS
jgi:hypothetical protein